MTHYHGILIFGILGIICTGIAMYFTFKANLGSSAKSTRIEGHASRTEGIAIDIKQKNEELLKKNSELKSEVDELRLENLTLHRELRDETKLINDNITGGNSYPLLSVELNEKTRIPSYFLMVKGNNNLNNLKFTSLNITEISRFHGNNPDKFGFVNYIQLDMEKEARKSYEVKKQKAYSSSTRLKDGNYSSKLKEFAGNHSFDFSGSTSGEVTAILIEAQNGKFYHLFNWGRIDSYTKYPSYNVLVENLLFNEDGIILYKQLLTQDWFYSQSNKFNKLENIDFEDIKKYFDEKKRMSTEK